MRHDAHIEIGVSVTPAPWRFMTMEKGIPIGSTARRASAPNGCFLLTDVETVSPKQPRAGGKGHPFPAMTGENTCHAAMDVEMGPSTVGPPSRAPANYGSIRDGTIRAGAA